MSREQSGSDPLAELTGTMIREVIERSPLREFPYRIDTGTQSVAFDPMPTDALLRLAGGDALNAHPASARITQQVEATPNLAGLPFEDLLTDLVDAALEIVGVAATVARITREGVTALAPLSYTEALLLDDRDHATMNARVAQAPTGPGVPRLARGGDAAGIHDQADTVLDETAVAVDAASPHLDDTCRLHEIRLVLDQLADGDLSAPDALRRISLWAQWTEAGPVAPQADDEPF